MDRKVLGERLAEIRNAAGETQHELAEAIGVKRETVVQWEHGTRHLKAEAVVTIAQHYNISADYLLGLPPVDKRNEDTQFALRNLTQSIIYIHSCANIALNSLHKYLENELNMCVSETIHKEE